MATIAGVDLSDLSPQARLQWISAVRRAIQQNPKGIRVVANGQMNTMENVGGYLWPFGPAYIASLIRIVRRDIQDPKSEESLWRRVSFFEEHTNHGVITQFVQSLSQGWHLDISTYRDHALTLSDFDKYITTSSEVFERIMKSETDDAKFEFNELPESDKVKFCWVKGLMTVISALDDWFIMGRDINGPDGDWWVEKQRALMGIHPEVWHKALVLVQLVMDMVTKPDAEFDQIMSTRFIHNPVHFFTALDVEYLRMDPYV
ncbi:hypothetical protein K491DRAFT_715989 [Lophiostoma macrostomum CBS 122681]|uniref:Uncharacterized protein n=1 Tax=Lophiostoma macrostomum CBS 122681 TaxID=1314788 RepID=A0A6A6T6N5_9PLEO|nr:hypothetical protein K491DRAFT_715989 [Lophiostoma macrostomum CBS 122681]